MEDTQQPDPEPNGEPNGEPNVSKSNKKMPRRKRKYTKVIDRRAKKAKVAPATPATLSDSSAGLEPPASAFVSTDRATRKVSKSVLETKLKHTFTKLNDAKTSLAARDKTIDSLSKKNKELTDTVKTSRETIRHSKSIAATTVKEAKVQIREKQAAASTYVQEAKAQVKKTEADVKNLQELLMERDNELTTLKLQHDKEIAVKVSDAVDKEQTRAARRLASVQSKAKSNLEKWKKIYALELDNKDKEIKRIKSISEGNTSVAIELRAENSKLRAQLEESLSSNNIKLREKVSAVTKRSAEQVNSLKQAVAQKDRDITEVNDMALHVADELYQFKNEKLAESRSTAKQLEHHKKLAANRLQKLTELQQVTVAQQATIDEMRENHEEQESMSASKIADLTLQLRKSGDKIETEPDGC